MTFSRTRIVACFVVLTGAGGVSACGSLIGIGDPSLDTEEAGTLPAEASIPEAAPVDAAPKDSGVDSAVPDAGQLPCGPDTMCPRASTVCCVYKQRQGPPPFKYECTAACRPADAVADLAVTLNCTTGPDCPGKQCCLRVPFQSSTGVAKCEDSCGNGGFEMCTVGGPNTCSKGDETCRAFSTGFPSAYGYCD